MRKHKGAYILLAELATTKDIIIGKLGYVHFPQACYAYVGSAMNGFSTRLVHHLREDKKPYWHIDYLLKEASICDIILCPAEHGKECLLSQVLAREFQCIPNFGSSDCKCKSHLYFNHGKHKIKAKVVQMVDRAGFAREILSQENKEEWRKRLGKLSSN